MLAVVPPLDSPPMLVVPTISFTPSYKSPGEDRITSESSMAHHGYEGEHDSDQKNEDGDDEDDEDYTDNEEDERYYPDEKEGDDERIEESQYFQKSHVAVYEINARWGSRLMMILVTLGGLVSVLGGGLCAEHHCQDLQFCADGYQTHGNWCGPSGTRAKKKSCSMVSCLVFRKTN